MSSRWRQTNQGKRGGARRRTGGRANEVLSVRKGSRLYKRPDQIALTLSSKE